MRGRYEYKEDEDSTCVLRILTLLITSHASLSASFSQKCESAGVETSAWESGVETTLALALS